MERHLEGSEEGSDVIDLSKVAGEDGCVTLASVPRSQEVPPICDITSHVLSME